MPQLMTPTQVSEFLQVSEDTLANWRNLQRGPAYVRQDEGIRYPTDAISAWISTHEAATHG